MPLPPGCIAFVTPRYDSLLADYVADRHVPIKLAISERNQVAPDGDLWLSVLESTAQPMNML